MYTLLRKELIQNKGTYFTQLGQLKVQEMGKNLLETVTQVFHIKTNKQKQKPGP